MSYAPRATDVICHHFSLVTLNPEDPHLTPINSGEPECLQDTGFLVSLTASERLPVIYGEVIKKPTKRRGNRDPIS